MTPEAAIDIIRQALMITLWTIAPLLVIAVVVGIVVNIIQVATSLQDSAFSTVPRLAVFLGGFLLLLPWMLSRLMSYTTSLFGDLGRYAR
jgi:flagellar biosynthesis protein FliQ